MGAALDVWTFFASVWRVFNVRRTGILVFERSFFFFSFLFFSYSIDEQIGRGSRQNRLEASSFFSLDEMF